jgi:proteasome lid subunit RPN8/RPN11
VTAPDARALRLSARRLAAVRAHARRRYPHECCGLLLGHEEPESGVRVEAVLPAANHEPSPRHGYFVAPRALLRGHRLARACGLQVVGYYHSHPDAGARPSRRDAHEALAGSCYLIVALAADRDGEARCFRWPGGGGEECAELPVAVAAVAVTKAEATR